MLSMCYNAMVDRKAEEVMVLDLRGISSIADFFVICHGSSARQVVAISDNVETALRKSGRKRYHVEGRSRGNWVLMDYHDMVLHIFDRPTRAFYSLEKLWSDAKKMDEIEILAWGN